MSDELARFEAVRAAGRRLDAAAAVPLNRAGPNLRNGEARGGWLKTLFGGSAPARAESPKDRAAYLLMCQSVVAAHVIDRATTATFPRAGGAADYAVRQVALPAEVSRGLRNTARAEAPDFQAVVHQPRARAGLVASLVSFLK